MAGFGKGTDYFDIPTEISNTDLHLISSSKTPAPQSIEHARDEDGNIAGQGDYDGGPADAVECVYELQGGTLDTADLFLGEVDNNGTKLCAVSIDVETSNNAWPKITVSGYTGVTESSDYPQFYLPSVTIDGKKQAQELDFTTGADCKLNSSKMSAKGDFHHSLDEDGAVGPMAFTGATCEISAEFVEIAAAASWTLGGDWTETQAPGAENSNISWGTGNGTAMQYLEKETQP
jgi:hypothetical protein